MTRSKRRPLVAGTLAASAALVAGLLGGCSAGQVAQTAQVAPAVAGANAQASGYAVDVRNAAVDYLEPKGYPQGAKVPLSLWIFNSTHQPVSLIQVTAAQTGGGQNLSVPVVQSVGMNTAAPCVVPNSPSPTPAATSAAPSPTPSRSTKSGSPAPSVSSSPTESPSPSPSPAGSATINVTIPAGGCLELSPRAAQFLQVIDLPQALGNQDALSITFGFSTGDGQSFTIGGQPMLRIPVSVPRSPLPRVSPT